MKRALILFMMFALMVVSAVGLFAEEPVSQLVLGMAREDVVIDGFALGNSREKETGTFDYYDGIVMGRPAKLSLKYVDNKLEGAMMFVAFPTPEAQKAGYDVILEVFKVWDDNILCFGTVTGDGMTMMITVYHDGYVDILYIDYEADAYGNYCVGIGKVLDPTSVEARQGMDSGPPPVKGKA